MDKWFGSPVYEAAAHALGIIVEELENPSYAQIIEVLYCMKDFAAEMCAFTIQK